MASERSDEILLEVQESLGDGPFACTSLTRLSGGTANFVYRGILTVPLPDGSETVVIKHSEGYVAQTPSFKITTTRCDYEQTITTALAALPPSTHSNITVQTPLLHLFSPATNTQVYSDLPSSLDLKTYALKYGPALAQPQCAALGHALGLWTRRFHDWAQADEQRELVESMGGNVAMRDLKFTVNYDTLIATIACFPEVLEGSRGVFERVRESRLREKGGEGAVLIHGDFWSGNILLPDRPILPSGDPTSIFIVDWELSQVASPAFDLGQMFAELLELKHFKDIDAGVWIIEAFMAGYGGIGEEMAFRTAVHVGTHLICWGSRVPGWGSPEQVRAVVEVGRGFVVNGWERESGFFADGPLECLFSCDPGL
ncbi:hypothetical protein B2J93_1148 [Marssonina coronariae]|uniref:Aminoglycoside phosphotransferase domain-containing protein n=1 Tax=Diplocarpon coronariae TaxID=2795749 RepID=A0A218YWY1_9HELO|nr:hypothetical protein JHW43_001609 [Diplocarpon mali]OWO99260.1 hypothetical protein B2J93_1148 [Marssonina coronariae]